MDCPVQCFLVYASVEKGAKGFIHVREIRQLMGKLIYGVRSCVFNEFMMRCDGRVAGNTIDGELGGLIPELLFALSISLSISSIMSLFISLSTSLAISRSRHSFASSLSRQLSH